MAEFFLILFAFGVLYTLIGLICEYSTDEFADVLLWPMVAIVEIHDRYMELSEEIARAKEESKRK